MIATKGFISSSGLKIYYETEGEGQPLVLVSGGPGYSHEYFQPLHALAPDARLIFYDQRGTGQSDKANLQDYTVEANVEDLEQLRRELQLDSCIGSSELPVYDRGHLVSVRVICPYLSP